MQPLPDHLSGTPFRALTEGEFLEEQIYNWTYVDEQKAKMEWTGKDNPYESLPKMIMLTYKLPNQVLDIVKTGEFNEFDLNTFFSAKGEGEKSKFIYEEEVQKWLDFIRGSLKSENLNNLKVAVFWYLINLIFKNFNAFTLCRFVKTN